MFKKDFLALGKIFDIKGKFFSFLILIKITQTYVVSGRKKISKKGGGEIFQEIRKIYPSALYRYLQLYFQLKIGKRTEIYHRLMEPDVEADYKNLAIKLVDPQVMIKKAFKGTVSVITSDPAC